MKSLIKSKTLEILISRLVLPLLVIHAVIDMMTYGYEFFGYYSARMLISISFISILHAVLFKLPSRYLETKKELKELKKALNKEVIEPQAPEKDNRMSDEFELPERFKRELHESAKQILTCNLNGLKDPENIGNYVFEVESTDPNTGAVTVIVTKAE